MDQANVERADGLLRGLLLERWPDTGEGWWGEFELRRTHWMRKRNTHFETYSETRQMVDHGWQHAEALYCLLPRFIWAFERATGATLFANAAEAYALMAASYLHDVGMNVSTCDLYGNFRRYVERLEFPDLRTPAFDTWNDAAAEYERTLKKDKNQIQEPPAYLAAPFTIRKLHAELGAWICKTSQLLATDEERETIAQIVLRHRKDASKSDSSEAKSLPPPHASGPFHPVRTGFLAALIALLDACHTGRSRSGDAERHMNSVYAEIQQFKEMQQLAESSGLLYKWITSQIDLLRKQPKHIFKHLAVKEICVGPNGFVIVPAIPETSFDSLINPLQEFEPGSKHGDLVCWACKELQDEFGNHDDPQSVAQFLCQTLGCEKLPAVPTITAESWSKEWKAKAEENNRLWEEEVKRQVTAIGRMATKTSPEGVVASLIPTYDPVDFASFLMDRRRDFCGREWMFKKISTWSKSGCGRSLIILGDPGIGKSAIIAELVHRVFSEKVAAHYCCRGDVKETLKPERFLKTIAAMLASRLPDYAKLLSEPGIAEALSPKRLTEDPVSSFEEAILSPLCRIKEPLDGPYYLLIDALDEALTFDDLGPNIVDVLARRTERFPDWLRVIATSRKSVYHRFSGIAFETLDAEDPENRRDIRKFIEKRLKSGELRNRLDTGGMSRQDFVRILVEKSAGNFLYVRTILDAVEHRHLNASEVDALPTELGDLYTLFFKRLFADKDHYAEVQPVLEVMVAANEPLTEDILSAASLMDIETQLPRALRLLSDYLDVHDEHYSLYHRSLAEWLVDKQNRGTLFYVGSKVGYRRLAEFCWKEYERGPAIMSRYALTHMPRHLASAEEWERLWVAAADDGFLAAQAGATPEDPRPPIRTIELALDAATKQDDPVRMAQFLLKLARKDGYGMKEESPLDALRAGNLARAWALSDLLPSEESIMSTLLVTWELKDLGRMEEAIQTLARLHHKRLIQLTDWREDCAANILANIFDICHSTYPGLWREIIDLWSWDFDQTGKARLVKVLRARGYDDAQTDAFSSYGAESYESFVEAGDWARAYQAAARADAESARDLRPDDLVLDYDARLTTPLAREAAERGSLNVAYDCVQQLPTDTKVWALLAVAECYWKRNAREQARNCIAEVLEIARNMAHDVYLLYRVQRICDADLPPLNAETELLRGSAVEEDDLGDESASGIEAVLQIAREIGDMLPRVQAFGVIAEALFHCGQNDRAFQCVGEALKDTAELSRPVDRIAVTAELAARLSEVQRKDAPPLFDSLLSAMKAQLDFADTQRTDACATLPSMFFEETSAVLPEESFGKLHGLAHSFLFFSGQAAKADHGEVKVAGWDVFRCAPGTTNAKQLETWLRDRDSVLDCVASIAAGAGDIGMVREALDEIAVITRRDRARGDACIYLLQRGDVDFGLGILNEIGDKKTRLEALAKAAIALHQLGRSKEAEERLQEAISTSRDMPSPSGRIQALCEIATAQCALGHRSIGRQTFKEAALLAPEVPIRKVEYPEREDYDPVWAAQHVAYAQAHAGEFTDALETAYLSQDSSLVTRLVKRHYQAKDDETARQGLNAVYSKLIEERRKALAERGILILPHGKEEIWVALVDAWLERGEHHVALECAPDLLAKPYRTFHKKEYIAAKCFQNGDYVPAIEVAEQIEPASERLRALLPLVEIDTGKAERQQARSVVDALLKEETQSLNPVDGIRVCSDMALRQWRNGDKKTARQMWKVARSLSENRAETLLEIAKIQFAVGDRRSAGATIMELRKAALCELDCGRRAEFSLDAAVLCADYGASKKAKEFVTDCLEAIVVIPSTRKDPDYQLFPLRDCLLARAAEIQAMIGEPEAAMRTAKLTSLRFRPIKEGYFRPADAVNGTDWAEKMAAAQAHTSHGKHNEAVAALDEAFKVACAEPNSECRDRMLVDVARMQAALGCCEKAVKVFREIIEYRMEDVLRVASTAVEPQNRQRFREFVFSAKKTELGNAFSVLGQAVNDARNDHDPWYRDQKLAEIAHAQAVLGLCEEALEMFSEVADPTGKQVLNVASAVARAGDRQRFKVLIPLAARHADIACRMCGSLSELYPEHAATLFELLADAFSRETSPS